MFKTLKLMTVAGITTASFVAFAGPGSVSTNPTNPGTQPSVTDHSLTPPPTTTTDGNSTRTTFDDARDAQAGENMGLNNSKKNMGIGKNRNMSGFGLTTDQVREAQSQLSLNGHSVAVDGILGPQTAKAIRAFQADQGLEQSGALDGATLKALNLDSSDRAPASVEDEDDMMDHSEGMK